MLTPVPIQHGQRRFPPGAAVFRSPLPVTTDGSETLKEAIASGVTAVVQLLPSEEAARLSGMPLETFYRELGWKVLHLPIVDGGVCSLERLTPAVARVERWLEQGRKVLVHCSAGVGRTGLFLTCLTRRIARCDSRAAQDLLANAGVPLLLTPWQSGVARAYDPGDPLAQ